MPAQELALCRPTPVPQAFVDLTQRWRGSRVVPTLQVGRRGPDVGGGAGFSGSSLPVLGRVVSGQSPVCDPLGLLHKQSDTTECTHACVAGVGGERLTGSVAAGQGGLEP